MKRIKKLKIYCSDKMNPRFKWIIKHERQIVFTILLTIIAVVVFGFSLDFFQKKYCGIQKFIKLRGIYSETFQTTMLQVTVSIWAATITIVTFMLGKLDDVFFGVSLKRLVVICLGRFGCVCFTGIYILLLPLLYFAWRRQLYNTFLWCALIAYSFSVFFIIFMGFIACKNNVVELIRLQTMRELKDKKRKNEKNAEDRFPVMQMIKSINFDDMWQLDQLQYIMQSMIKWSIEENDTEALSNAVFALIKAAEKSNDKNVNAVVNIVKMLINGNKLQGKETEEKTNAVENAILGMMIPFLKTDNPNLKIEWCRPIMEMVSDKLKGEVLAILLLYAEYLLRCEIYCEAAVNEVVDEYCKNRVFFRVQIDDEFLKKMKRKFMKYWMEWSRYDEQQEIYFGFVDKFWNDFIKLDYQLSASKILFQVQRREMTV